MIGRVQSHHPSVAMHQVRGEAIVWLYVHILLDVIYDIEKHIQHIENKMHIHHKSNTVDNNKINSSGNNNMGNVNYSVISHKLANHYHALIEESRRPLPKDKLCSPWCDYPPK